MKRNIEGMVEVIKLTEKTKINIEKRIMFLSLIGSILFMLVEGIMAYFSHSHSILIDFVFAILFSRSIII